MVDPYRRRPPPDPPAPSRGRGSELATVVFGLCCAVLGVALAGRDGLRCTIGATVAGTALILLRREPR